MNATAAGPAGNPFDPSGNGEWLKGNLHCHSTNSDGGIAPVERAARYAAAGYDFLCISDHDRITRLDGPPGLVMVPGVELHPANPYGGQKYHLLALGVSEDIDARPLHPQEAIDAVAAQGASVWAAHPYWSSMNARRDLLPLSGLAGIEVFNTTCARKGRGESSLIWDDWMAHLERPLPALAADDAHNNPFVGDDEFQAWTMVKARERSPRAVLEALTRGDAYATTGPAILSVTLDYDTQPLSPAHSLRVTVRCSPAVRLVAVCDIYGADTPRGPAGAEFEQATLWLPSTTRWVRLEVIDARGCKAWSNPFVVADAPAG